MARHQTDKWRNITWSHDVESAPHHTTRHQPNRQHHAIIALLRRHGPMSHFCWWNKFVANPIKKFGFSGPGRTAMRVLKEEILPLVLLRRTKVQCADVLCLPPRCAMH